jgi:hypothetical protein
VAGIAAGSGEKPQEQGQFRMGDDRSATGAFGGRLEFCGGATGHYSKPHHDPLDACVARQEGKSDGGQILVHTAPAQNGQAPSDQRSRLTGCGASRQLPIEPVEGRETLFEQLPLALRQMQTTIRTGILSHGTNRGELVSEAWVRGGKAPQLAPRRGQRVVQTEDDRDQTPLHLLGVSQEPLGLGVAQPLANAWIFGQQAIADGLKALNELHVVHATPSGLDIAAFYHDTKRLVETARPACLVIDGLRDFLAAAGGEREQEHYLALFNDLLFRNGVTAVYTWRVEDVAGLSSVASIPHTAQADNIIYLGLVELESKLRKVIAIFKTRGELIDNSLRELVVTATDVKVSNLFTGLSGILQGSASGRLSEAGREILEPMMHIREFVNSAEVSTVEQARFIVDNIRREFNVLAAKVAEHFGGKAS